MSMGRAIALGALLAFVSVVIVGGLVATGTWSPVPRPDAPVDGPVLVALVLPDDSGTLVPQAIDVYTRAGTGWSVSSVSPTLPAVVSGTSGRTLADAYTYGGGGELAKAYATLGRGLLGSWVVVGPEQWAALADSRQLQLDLPARMEVFDGSRLVAFEEGSATVPAGEVGLLLSGARYLTADQNAAVRRQVGDSLSLALAAASPPTLAGLKSDLRPARLTAWARSLARPTRAFGD